MSPAPEVLAVRDLHVSFVQYRRGLRRSVLPVLRGIDLVASAGRLVALVGTSGAGKSVLAHAVLGLLPANALESGTVAIHGQERTPWERREAAGRTVSLLPQSVTYLDPVMPVAAQVTRAARLAGVDRPREATAALFARLGLSEADLQRYPHELSGGMARRVLFAAATIGRPDLVLADEPTPGLHEEAVAEVMAQLRALADEGTAVVVITHDLPSVLAVADGVVVLRDGAAHATCDPADFDGAGAHLPDEWTRALWQALPDNGFRLPAAAHRGHDRAGSAGHPAADPRGGASA